MRPPAASRPARQGVMKPWRDQFQFFGSFVRLPPVPAPARVMSPAVSAPPQSAAKQAQVSAFTAAWAADRLVPTPMPCQAQELSTVAASMWDTSCTKMRAQFCSVRRHLTQPVAQGLGHPCSGGLQLVEHRANGAFGARSLQRRPAPRPPHAPARRSTSRSRPHPLARRAAGLAGEVAATVARALQHPRGGPGAATRASGPSKPWRERRQVFAGSRLPAQMAWRSSGRGAQLRCRRWAASSLRPLSFLQLPAGT